MDRNINTPNRLSNSMISCIYFYAFSYPHPGSGHQAVEKSFLPHGFHFSGPVIDRRPYKVQKCKLNYARYNFAN